MYTHDELAELDDREYRDAYVDEHVRTTVAYQIYSIREHLGLTQKQFSEILGTSPSVISRLEDAEYGSVTINTLLNIAQKLDIALVVKFTSFPEFLEAYSDLSLEGLAVDSYEASKEKPVKAAEITAFQTSVMTAYKELQSEDTVYPVFGNTALYPITAVGTSASVTITGIALTPFTLIRAKTVAGENLYG